MHIPTNSTWRYRLATSLGTSLWVFLFLFSLHPLEAAEPPDPTAKLREQLRSVMLQLRTSQTNAANAQALQAAAEAKNADLAAQLKTQGQNIEKIVKQSDADKAALQESVTALETKVANREKRIVELNEELGKWKVGYEKAAGIARTTEDQRAKLAVDIVANQRVIADRERKNISLFNTANEILDRYEGYALGKALAAREPFIGTTRVKIENLVQGYKDKILDNRLSEASKKP